MRTAIFLFTAKIEVLLLDNNWSNHQATPQARNVRTMKLVNMLTTKLINEGLSQLCTQLKQLRKESLYTSISSKGQTFTVLSRKSLGTLTSVVIKFTETSAIVFTGTARALIQF